jgi:hypothetical protein
VAPALILALALGLPACKSKAPAGTSNPPGEGGNAAPTTGDLPATTDGGDSGAADTTGGDAPAGETTGGDAPVAAAPDCPAEVADKPTVLFNNAMFIRPPKGVEIIEQSPFFAITGADAVSACEAVVDRVAVAVLEDDGKPLAEKVGAFFEGNGYTGGTELEKDKDDKNDLRVTYDFPAGNGAKAARVYLMLQRKYGKVFVVLYQAEPDQYPGVVKSFKESANRVIIPPPKK